MGLGWDKLAGGQARGYEALGDRRQSGGAPSRRGGRELEGGAGGKDKTSAVPGLVWTCRASYQAQPEGMQRAPTWYPTSLTAPSLSHSAMAVESFTATAPFVQIGRFFLSAGKSLAPSDEQSPAQGPCASIRLPHKSWYFRS